MVMRKHFAVLATFLTLLLSSCSTHPLPENITRDNTLDIMTKIRCEARNAIVFELYEVIARIRSPQNTNLIRRLLQNRLTQEQINIALAARKNDHEKVAELLTNETDIFDLRQLVQSDVDANTFARIDKFQETVIAMTFRFAITEVNNHSGKGTLTMPFTGGKFTLGFGAGMEKKRLAERKLTISDSFNTLVTRLNCLEEIPRRNIVYPITGRIGMREVVKTYTDTALKGDISSFTDKLTFTTKVLGNLDPKVELTAPSTVEDFKLSQASLDIDDNRTDVHEVDISFKADAPDSGSGSAGNVGHTSPVYCASPDEHGCLLQPVPETTFAGRRPLFKRLDPALERRLKDAAIRDLRREESLQIDREIRDAIGR